MDRIRLNHFLTLRYDVASVLSLHRGLISRCEHLKVPTMRLWFIGKLID